MGQTKKTIQDWVMELYNHLADDEDFQYEKYKEQQDAEYAAYEEMLGDK